MAKMPNYYKIHTDGCTVELEAIYEELVPVVHGRWIPIEEKLWNLDVPVVVDWKCSVCNVTGNDDFDYCPNCGAKMDGERKVSND